jgi:2-polyprenyl-6-methoxyphenol hydroxylase-like FAD-dependent oxidoreductase
MQRMPVEKASSMTDTDIVVIGAGPVGMLAALLARKDGLSVTVLEKSAEKSPLARAIGISPPSLEILKRVGMDRLLVKNGVPVSQGEAFGNRGFLGRIGFSGINSDYRFILAIPQQITETLLNEALTREKSLDIRNGHTVTGFTTGKDGVVVTGHNGDGKPFGLAARFALACDGEHSVMRECSGIPFPGMDRGESFLMGDFEDTSGWGGGARLYFTSRGSLESFR